MKSTGQCSKTNSRFCSKIEVIFSGTYLCFELFEFWSCRSSRRVWFNTFQIKSFWLVCIFMIFASSLWKHFVFIIRAFTTLKFKFTFATTMLSYLLPQSTINTQVNESTVWLFVVLKGCNWKWISRSDRFAMMIEQVSKIRLLNLCSNQTTTILCSNKNFQFNNEWSN